jgi:hypothetical protein
LEHVIANNIVRPYKKFEIKIQKKEKALPTVVLGCRQITIFVDNLTVVLSAKVMASDTVGTLGFFADRLALPTVWLSAKMSFADRFILPTASYSCTVSKEFFTDSQ